LAHTDEQYGKVGAAELWIPETVYLASKRKDSSVKRGTVCTAPGLLCLVSKTDYMVIRMLIVIKQVEIPALFKKLSHRDGMPARVIPIVAGVIVLVS
jgi:hypothetical protein